MNVNRNYMSKLFTIAIAVFTALCGCNNQPKEKSNQPAEIMAAIAKMHLTDLKGQSIGLKQYEGKTIFINFWATWCKPCIQEMPFINEAQKILQNENIVFLVASAESIEEIESFSNNNNYNFNYVRIENSEEMDIQALPTTFIFNSKGQLAFSETGYRKWNEQNNINLILKIAKQNE